MDTVEWVKFLLNSPGFAALVTAGVAILAGHHLMEAKDQRIAGLQETHTLTLKALQDAHAEALRAKDDRIELLERRSPAKLQEDVDAMTALLQARSAQLQEELVQTRAAMEEHRRLSTEQRAVLENELAGREVDLRDVRNALEVAREASESVYKLAQQVAAAGRVAEVVALAKATLVRAASYGYVEQPGEAVKDKGFNLAVDVVLQGIDTNTDVLAELKFAASVKSISDRLKEGVAFLDFACDAYKATTSRECVGLIVAILPTDLLSEYGSTVRAVDSLKKRFYQVSRHMDNHIMLVDITEAALRQDEIDELRDRLRRMLLTGTASTEDAGS